MGLRFSELSEKLRGNLWFIPSLCVLASIGTATGLAILDRRLGHTLPSFLQFLGGPDAARQALSTIASSMITFTGLVFTITIVVLQLASSQFSPRVLRTFLRDRQSQVALGVFVATFVYAFVLLREVRTGSDTSDPFVPATAMALAFALVLVSVAVFIRYINHVARSIRSAAIVSAVAQETREAIDELYPEEPDPHDVPFDPPRDRTRVIPSPGPPGKLVGYDVGGLVKQAVDADVLLVLIPAIGDFVPEDAPLFAVHGDGDVGDLVAHVSFGEERTMRQDVAFGFRQLVDIAERALSPGVNDPTTAVQCIDQLHDLLRRLGRRPFPSGTFRDAEGAPRLVVSAVRWDDLVHLAVAEIRQYGTGSLQVARRLRAMLEDLRTIAPSDRRTAIDKELQLLDAAVKRGFPDEADRISAIDSDEQGIGS